MTPQAFLIKKSEITIPEPYFPWEIENNIGVVDADEFDDSNQLLNGIKNYYSATVSTILVVLLSVTQTKDNLIVTEREIDEFTAAGAIIFQRPESYKHDDANSEFLKIKETLENLCTDKVSWPENDEAFNDADILEQPSFNHLPSPDIDILIQRMAPNGSFEVLPKDD